MPTDSILQQLRDIHIPVEPGLWPLSLAWWLLFLLITIIIAGTSWWSIQRFVYLRPYRRIRRQARDLTAQFDQGAITIRSYVVGVNLLFKRLIVTLDKEPAAMKMFGSDWLTCLSMRFDEPRFLIDFKLCFGIDQYRKDTEFNGEQLRELVANTLYKVKPKRASHV